MSHSFPAKELDNIKQVCYDMNIKWYTISYNDFGPVHIDEVKQMLWDKLTPEEYEEPPQDWVPEDPKYRLWNEDHIVIPKISPRARKVVLRAKSKVDTVPNILND